MKYCFVGIGSIAKRHIENIKKIDKNSLIHAFRTGKSSYSKFNNIDKEIFEFEELDKRYDAIFITNPTSLHYDTLIAFLNKTDYFFIEKPVFDCYKHESELLKFKGKYTYVAAPLRFSSGIQYARKLIDEKGIPNSLRLISSSYLPDWRPNVDYRKTYSANKNLGGGVHIDLIHELDYLTYLVGIPSRSFYINKKVSNLEIDSYDVSISIHSFDNCVAEIHLDYFGRKIQRICELFYDEFTIQIDLISNSVSVCNASENELISLDKRDMYLDEMNYFIDFVRNNKKKSINDIFNANEELRIIYEGEECLK